MRVVALLAVVGALVATAPAGAVTYRDMIGREITLAAPPTRIVSLVPSVTELIYALGGEARLVGRTDFCDFPPAAGLKSSVGGMVAPNLEAIVALRADLVIGTSAGNRQETFQQLERLRIPVYVVAVERVAHVRDLVARVGELTGRPGAVGPFLQRFDERIAAVRTAVAPRRPPRVLYVLWPEPLIVPGRHSLITELIELAGGRSITGDVGAEYPRFSLEAVAGAAPEIILLANTGSRTVATNREQWERLASLPAIKGNRVHSVPGDLLHRYGPRMVDGLEHLARAIHPDAFR